MPVNNTHKTLILALGNEMVIDISMAPRLQDELKVFLNNDAIEYNNAYVGGLEILDFIEGYSKVIILDTIRTKEQKPGRVHYFTVENFQETMHLSSFHDTRFHTTLEMGKQLGMDIPTDITIIAVEIVEDTTFSADLTPEMQACYPKIIKEVKDYIVRKKLFNKTKIE